MTTGTHWGLTIAAAILVGLILTALYAGLSIITGGFGPWGGQFNSNGERIYYTATSDSGQSIVADLGHMVVSASTVACVDCHGPDGQGGPVWMMMGSFQAPDIRYQILTGEEHGEEGEEHPPYNDELIKRAISQGIDPAGKPLAWPMPRWRMSASDLEDLLDYLKHLE
jgi:mono/diheme cytochrome c family protein